MCEEYGYYEVTTGYRKIPGDKCTAGIQQHPAVYQCSGKRWLSFSGFLMICVFAAVIYFGWPIIEAILIMLPIPDPKVVRNRISDWLTKARAGIPKKDREMGGYMKDFEQAPGSLAELSDDDTEDVGKNFKDSLNYDSDEKMEGHESELIQLDTLPKPSKPVPRLKKPHK